AFLYGFDVLELGGEDLRRHPWKIRCATLTRLLRKASPGIRPTGATFRISTGTTKIRLPEFPKKVSLAPKGGLASGRSGTIDAIVVPDAAHHPAIGALRRCGGRHLVRPCRMGLESIVEKRRERLLGKWDFAGWMRPEPDLLIR